MTASIAATLIALAILDGSFSGFRSSVGRTGLIDHRFADRRAALRGAMLVCALLSPVVLIAVVDVAIQPAQLDADAQTGRVLLLVYGSYAVVVVLALLAYLMLGWRHRYVATALILGPGTLFRPVVAILGVVFAILNHGDLRADLLAAAAVLAVLAVEPLAGRYWYRSAVIYIADAVFPAGPSTDDD